ncbi:tRNA uridine-5-carboxymethylaminomethyl(34) synthesis GTPase MnmE [Magnetovibrio blakemorei]|uniref:tRNA modification GTPase MnmE n=1 Tax=Magnetovibrio blakemorei TaxID=28181 RepID=A0A1E5Q3Q9_9PROT|nr:tRNA uridine-5-carboxymethylaminomethyl(34) synthesis GTPase MnmE [Magnetovibrio blakemorei]OEJ64124.1 tRNA uridine(34) 5-carboxymethylaminomethyl synthesis GTPase MnmE [Magnetovibrio blakemorei]
MSSTDTIYALASGSGRAGVAVVRISGPQAGVALAALTAKPLPQPRRAQLMRLRHPQSQDILDDALVLWFQAPASFTGEDVVELHVHGGPAVIDGVLAALCGLEGLRLAEAGEFTRRAFENDKLDLTQVEGLADLIEAETEAQKKQALRQSEGELGRLYETWRSALIRALAHFEAELDFSDEELPEDLHTAVVEDVRTLLSALQAHLGDGRRGERLRSGVRLAIIGPPNAGKSSLMNALAQRDAAIVSDIAGTTRDVVEVYLNLGGYPLLVADTAGLRESGDVIEQEGVRRARHWAETADLQLAVFDGSDLPYLDASTRALLHVGAATRTIVAVNKSDLCTVPLPTDIDGHRVWPLCVKSGAGLDDLLVHLAQRVGDKCRLSADAPAPTRARHRQSLSRTVQALERFLARDNRQHMGAELEAEDLRLAARELGRITGRVNVEDLLDVIFRDFCIGK